MLKKTPNLEDLSNTAKSAFAAVTLVAAAYLAHDAEVRTGIGNAHAAGFAGQAPEAIQTSQAQPAQFTNPHSAGFGGIPAKLNNN